MHAARLIFDLLNRRQRLQFIIIVISAVITGFTQIVGIGLIIPFATLLLNPDALHDNAALNGVYLFLGFDSAHQFLFLLGILVLTALVIGNAYTAFTLWLMTRFSWRHQYEISVQLLSKYLYEDLSVLMQRKSSEIVRNVILESMQLSNGILLPLLNIMSSGISVFLLACVLIYLNPLVSSMAIASFGFGYALIYYFVRRPMLRLGRVRRRLYKERLKGVTEAFGSVKEVKVMGLESVFIDRYQPHAREAADVEVKFQVLTLLPRYAIETLAFGMVMTVLLVLMSTAVDMTTILPIAIAYAFAAFRLLPALQMMYRSVGAVRLNESVLLSVHKDLVPYNKKKTSVGHVERLPFCKNLILENVNFYYPGERKAALSSVNLIIEHGAHVAFAGKTGAGKSTLADIILGLIEPNEGRMIVDGCPITRDKLPNWQRSFGIVPQEIYLLDDSVAANIAFGLPHEEIDMEAVESAAEKANIAEFISQSLPNGYNTEVGERGVRLSGGQRQRIGLARAFYHNPPILLLDEASSALDATTEKAVQERILDDREGRTVIVIAHRLTTIQSCDLIYYLEEGRITAQGTYTELLNSCPGFRSMAMNSVDD